MNQPFLNTVLKFVEVGSATVKRAMDEVGIHEAGQKRAAALAAPLLDKMVSEGVIAPTHKEAAAAMLGSHAESLNLLKAASDKITELNKKLAKQAGELGQGESEKGAADISGANGSGKPYDSLNDPFMGRKTGEKKASDLALMKVLENPTR